MTRRYPVGLVGEQNYQPAVARVSPGQNAFIVHEPDNRFDPKALAVKNERGELIGYIARDSFIQRLWHDEGQEPIAFVSRVHDHKGFRQVVIEVLIDGEEANDDADFDADDSSQAAPPPARPEANQSTRLGDFRVAATDAGRSGCLVVSLAAPAILGVWGFLA